MEEKATNLSKTKEKIKGVWSKAKCFAEENKNKIANVLHILAYSSVMFLWMWAMAGNVFIGLTFLVTGLLILGGRKLTENKLKWLFWFIFAGVMFGAFFVSGLTEMTYPAMRWAYIAICGIIYWTFRSAQNKREWTLGAIMPFLIVAFAEYMQSTTRCARNVLFNLDYLQHYVFLLPLFILALTACFFTQVFNSKRIAHYITIGAAAILSIVNFFVIEITEQPFTWPDMANATAALGVVEQQNISGDAIVRFIIGIILLVGLYVVVTVVYPKKRWQKRIGRRIALFLCLCLCIPVLTFSSNVLNGAMLRYAGHTKYGFLGNFFITINSSLNIPDDAKDYVIEDKNDEGEYKPNVIIIMNEAFSDICGTFGVETSEDPLEYFRTLQAAYPSGVACSSVRGNNTCSSEWELLSSSPTALTIKGATIYQDNAIPMRSIVSLFNDRGYTTVGLHPYYAAGYNRNTMYDNLGFSQSYFIEDLPRNLDKVRSYVSDSANYAELIRLFEENEAQGDKPFFCFNITMQNHGAYTADPYDDITAVGYEDKTDLSTYLSMVNKSDDALKELVEYFSNVEEDTIILFFGDHQPLVGLDFYESIYNKEYADFTLDEVAPIYEVPYLIWANYELNKEAAPDETSICYLANILCEVGNLPKSTWLNMVDQYQDVYPVITCNFIKLADGSIYEPGSVINAKSKDLTDPLTLYQKYSYGILYGLPD